MRLNSALLITAVQLAAADKIKVLLVDGQNNHRWMETSPVIKKQLEDTGLFEVDVSTSPAKGADMAAFRPGFKSYRVVVSNYNGDPWSAEAKSDFEQFVRNGGGFVSVHAADNSFPEWPAYNEMIALGGWGNRTEKDGPYAKFRDGKLVLDHKPGKGGHHGRRHAYAVTVRDSKHPITRGLPETWMHHVDELYDSLRGPAKGIHLLATAFSAPDTGGTGEHEPMLFTTRFGKGRVFHTTLGHDVEAMKCAGHIVTLQRGTEWAATGKVTQKVPADFPGAEKASLR
ncbi:MAG: ThuA domain-containing protein [Acidobacteria bacterium]|nr:ThuA domain-containing protein [Acidobacteriota bacterium]